MTDGTTTWTYTYDANGLRTSRSNGTTTYNYIYNGSSLVQMTVGNDTLYFAYDSSSPMTVTYNGTVYYYVTNLQGDVIAILDSAGAAVVEYTYDAWGNTLSTTGSMANILGAVNPLRYRGYVYDAETGLYYLQSRYYNPEIGRFINADAFITTGQGFLGNNMFAYCNCNPTNLCDPGGAIPFYDDPLQKAIEDFFQWYWNTDENEKDKNGHYTIAAKAKRTIQSFVHNLELTAGGGVGAGKKLEILGIGVSLCAKYDIIAMQCLDDSWSWGQRIAMSASTALTQVLELGGGFDVFTNFSDTVDANRWILYNNTKESWTLFAYSNYSLFLGGSIEIAFDLNTFLAEVTDIWED